VNACPASLSILGAVLIRREEFIVNPPIREIRVSGFHTNAKARAKDS
jgi:hypothetical protein